MTHHYARVIIAVAVIAIIAVILSLATYSLSPGQTALVLHSGSVRAVVNTPGLHWKAPLFQNIIEVDTRTQASAGRVSLKPSDDKALSAQYVVFWHVVNPERYYEGTDAAATVVGKRLNAALTPVLRKAMSQGDAQVFLSGPSSRLRDEMDKTVKPIADKVGIEVLGVYCGTSHIPQDLTDKIATTMAASIQTQIAAVKAAGKRARHQIAVEAATKSAAIMAEARSKAGVITGKSQARVAAFYAPIAKKAPGFFNYFIDLESEADALKSNTRVLVLSMDSPWFKTLEHSANRARHKE